MLIGKYLVYSISNTIDLGAIKKYFSLVELVILVLVRGSCSRGRIAMHRQLRQLLTIRLKKKKRNIVGLRCASLPRRTKLFRRTIERGQKSSRCYVKRYEAMETSRRASASHFPSPVSPHGPLLSFDFPRFPAEQVASFPTSRSFNIEIWLPLLVSMFLAFTRHSTRSTRRLI